VCVCVCHISAELIQNDETHICVKHFLSSQRQHFYFSAREQDREIKMRTRTAIN
jgi:hypothetical protein